MTLEVVDCRDAVNLHLLEHIMHAVRVYKVTTGRGAAVVEVLLLDILKAATSLDGAFSAQGNATVL